MSDNVKGFRQQPKPSKGEVAKENAALSGQIMNALQFMQNQTMNLMRKSQEHETEIGALSELLGYNESTGVAQVGDKMMISYLGRLIAEDGTLGDIFDGGFSRMALIGVGSGKFIPGFEEALVGTKAGETVSLEITFPENYPPALAKKRVNFKVAVFKVLKSVANFNELETEHNALIELKLAAAKAKLEAEAATQENKGSGADSIPSNKEETQG